ncbi:PREDICTED: uncharacterized protein LOC106807616 isoform X2 [Priapulus caudatus]|uniref:Uncharacterized protein LOC106807616 isoform X2 n=1 Tax=Priapulus caudatus TaxID=37621 RepID=A0ABM1DZY6_PRICU|nr:PREDICTED: uncharacterized protein LOC106807616 isoform X2 [Priapulus caudatus]
MDRLLRSKNKCLIEQLHHQQACMHMSLEKLRGVEDEGQNAKLYTIRAKPTDHTENMAQDQMLQNVNDGDFIQQQYSSTPISCGTRQAQAPYNCTIHINQLPEANCVVQSGDHEEGIQLKQTRSCIVNSPVKVQYVKPTVDRSIQTDQAKLQTVETCTTTDLPVTPDVKNNAANGDSLRINVLKKRYDALRKYYQDGIEDQPCLQRPSHTHTPPRVSCGELHDYFYTNYPSRYFRDLSNVSPTLQRTNGKSWFEARGRTPMYKSGGMRYPSSSSRPSPYDAAKQQHLSQNLRGLDLSHLRQKKGSDNKGYGVRHQDCMGHAMKDRRDKVQPFQLYAPWLDLRKDKDSELWTDDSSQRDLLQGGVESSDDGNVRRAVKPVTTNSPIDGGSGRKAIGKVIFLGSTAVDRKTEPPKPPPSASSVDEDDSKFLDYLETLELFRRQYPNECMSPMRPSWLGFNVNERSADSQEQGYVGCNPGTDIPDHQLHVLAGVFDYKLNGRLFPEAVHTDRENRSICPTCKSPERVPTSTNPTYTRISVSRSALAPPYRLQHRTKQAFMLKGSLALSQHCLAGHQYTGEITRPETSTVDLRTEMNKDKLATQVLPPDGTRTTTQELLTRSHKIRQSFNRILMDSRHRPADMKHQRPLPLF